LPLNSSDLGRNFAVAAQPTAILLEQIGDVAADLLFGAFLILVNVAWLRRGGMPRALSAYGLIAAVPLIVAGLFVVGFPEPLLMLVWAVITGIVMVRQPTERPG
jgi:hypothetical protein